MSVAKVTEITAESGKDFKVDTYRVTLKVTFVLK